MVALDAFILSHTFEPLLVHDQDRVDAYLPPYKPLYSLDPADPRAWGGLVAREHYYEIRYKIYKNMERALDLLREAGQEFGEVIGPKPYAVTESFMMDDADHVIVSMGSMTSNARLAVKLLRDRGEKVGLLKMVAFRPFPFKEVREALSGRKKVAVLDRNMSPGHSGVFSEEIRSALYHEDKRPDIYGYIIGIGGRDVRVNDIIAVYEDMAKREQPENILYVGVKGLPTGPGHERYQIRPLEPQPKEAER
jgi:pyruvate/2-oxoacid:ferredoxin oxidoreductase alpha subunit